MNQFKDSSSSLQGKAACLTFSFKINVYSTEIHTQYSEENESSE